MVTSSGKLVTYLADRVWIRRRNDAFAYNTYTALRKLHFRSTWHLKGTLLLILFSTFYRVIPYYSRCNQKGRYKHESETACQSL